jgi:hypothetical protein
MAELPIHYRLRKYNWQNFLSFFQLGGASKLKSVHIFSFRCHVIEFDLEHNVDVDDFHAIRKSFDWSIEWYHKRSNLTLCSRSNSCIKSMAAIDYFCSRKSDIPFFGLIFSITFDSTGEFCSNLAWRCIYGCSTFRN